MLLLILNQSRHGFLHPPQNLPCFGDSDRTSPAYSYSELHDWRRPQPGVWRPALSWGAHSYATLAHEGIARCWPQWLQQVHGALLQHPYWNIQVGFFHISCTSFPVFTDHIPVHCYFCDSRAFGGLFVYPPWENRLDRGEPTVLLGINICIARIYKWYNLCVLGGKRDVLGISWVWRFCAAVHGQVPVCSNRFLADSAPRYICFV